MSNPESVNDLGYINMPDADTPDPAHDTLPHIEEALAAPAEQSGNSGEFAATAGEQVGLTDAELDEIWTKHAMSATFDCVHLLRDAIAAHEAKRASCSQTAKKSTHEVGRVDETEKSEHVGGAA